MPSRLMAFWARRYLRGIVLSDLVKTRVDHLHSVLGGVVIRVRSRGMAGWSRSAARS